jgi:hypothetical protein
MKRIIGMIYACLISFTIIASDYFPAKLLFTNGEIIKGYAKLPSIADEGIINSPLFGNEKWIYFKLKPDSLEIKYPSDELKSIIYQTENGSETYERMRRYDLTFQDQITQPEWLKIVEKGYATLYYNKCIKGTMIYKVWSCYREGEVAAKTMAISTVGPVLILNKNGMFKKSAKKYFSDFPEIKTSLKSKKYNLEKYRCTSERL